MTQFSSHPENAKIITSDITHFWEAFDAGITEENFQKLYLDRASQGLQIFLQERIENVGNLVRTIQARLQYYAAIRQKTAQISHLEPQIEQLYAQARALYSDAAPAKTYFVIGCFTSGGISFSEGQIIGTEFFARDEYTPTHELNAWQFENTRTLDAIPAIIAHEYVHFIHNAQHINTPPREFSVLDAAFTEGLAEYFGELFSGQKSNLPHMVYGYAHEAALWQQFQSQMHSTQIEQWFYQGNTAKDHPADLGYFIGYRIVQHYFEKAADPKQAFLELIRTQNPLEIVQISGYRGTI